MASTKASSCFSSRRVSAALGTCRSPENPCAAADFRCSLALCQLPVGLASALAEHEPHRNVHVPALAHAANEEAFVTLGNSFRAVHVDQKRRRADSDLRHV